MAWTTVAVVGGSLVGGMIASDGSKSAANTQASASNHAADVQQQMFNTVNEQQAPWRQAGATALSQLGTATADPNDPNSLLHTFTAADLKNGLAPNYDFQLKQGQDATNNAASVTGGLVGGNALKGLQDYTQGAAGNAYQQAFNNYNSQQTNIFNRLSNIAGLGQTANQTTAQAGTTAAGNMGSAYMAGGAAQAAGQVGSANAISGGLNSLSSMYGLNNLTNGRLFGTTGGVTPGAPVDASQTQA